MVCVTLIPCRSQSAASLDSAAAESRVIVSIAHSEKDAADQSITLPPTHEREHNQRERFQTSGLTDICHAYVSISGPSVQPRLVASLKSKCAPPACQALRGDAAERVTVHPLLATPGFLI